MEQAKQADRANSHFLASVLESLLFPSGVSAALTSIFDSWHFALPRFLLSDGLLGVGPANNRMVKNIVRKTSKT